MSIPTENPKGVAQFLLFLHRVLPCSSVFVFSTAGHRAASSGARSGGFHGGSEGVFGNHGGGDDAAAAAAAQQKLGKAASQAWRAVVEWIGFLLQVLL